MNLSPTEKTNLFRKVELMLNKKAWDYARTYHLDFEECQSQAYLIFCEALEKYDPSKEVRFSTFLHSNLWHLNDLAHKETQQSFTVNFDKFEGTFDRDYQSFSEVVDRLEAKVGLLDDAQELLSFILSREWEVPGMVPCRPYLSSTSERFKKEKNWSFQRTWEAWQEVKTWWRERGQALA